MKITVFGATGLLGKALMRQWTGDTVTGLASRDADIRDARAVEQVMSRTQPHWTVLAAAYTDVDGCETNSGLAFEVNTHGAANVAEAARQSSSRLLFISSDYVFDGTKTTPYETSDQVSPRSVYGQTKAQAEEQIRGILPDACIVRTSWLFGAGGKCFPDTILNLAAQRNELQVVNDQRGSPTYAEDLAAAIIQLCRKGAEGTVHATNRGDCTWFDFAEEIVSQAGLATTINPTTSDKFVRPAPRPAYSILSPSSLDKFSITMPRWKNALKDYLRRRKAEGP